ncbi:MAG: thioesterase family protein [Planctomycetales bacterium]
MLKEHEIQIRVRYKETDAMGYLHHANYFVYFEMGRTELLRAQGGNYRQMEDEGFLMVVVRLNCRFKLPARYDDLLTLKTRVTKVGMAKLEHAYELWRGDILLAEAESTLGCVDRDGKVQVMPAHIRGEAS